MQRQLNRTMWATDEGEGGAVTPQPAGGQSRTFTQEQLDAIVGERATRAKSAAISELLGELGFEKTDDLKALVQSAREQADKQKSETQKLQEKLADYQKREQQWALEKRDTMLQIAVQAASAKLGIVDAEVALALIRDTIEFDNDGKPQGVEAALSKLLADKPYLKAGTSTSPTNPPRQGATLTKADIEKMTPEQINENWEAVQAALAK
jgi:hypothetical protein